jgi:DNA adenine methylase
LCAAATAHLAAQLAGARGKFLLSLNDHPGVRECFAAFQIQSIDTTYTIGGVQRAGEVIISNFKP